MRLAVLPLLALTSCPPSNLEEAMVQSHRHDLSAALAAEGEAENEAESEELGERPSEPEAEESEPKEFKAPAEPCLGAHNFMGNFVTTNGTACPVKIGPPCPADDPMSWSGFGSKFRRGDQGISVGDVPPEPRQTGSQGFAGSQSFIDGVDRTLQFVIEK